MSQNSESSSSWERLSVVGDVVLYPVYLVRVLRRGSSATASNRDGGQRLLSGRLLSPGPSGGHGGAAWHHVSLAFVILCLAAVFVVLATSPAAADPGQCPTSIDLAMNLILPPYTISRGNTAGDVYTVTLANNSSTAATEIGLLVDPNVGFYYLGGSAAAASSVSGTLTIVDPGTGAPDAPFTIGISATPQPPEKQLLPGETITFTFRLATNANAKSGQRLEVKLRSGSPEITCKTAGKNVKTARGNLTVEKSPVTQDGSFGETVTWTLALKNTGLGTLYGAILTDTIGSGYMGYQISPTPAPVDLAPNASQAYTVSAVIASCTNLTNTIVGSWSIGNSDGTATAANPLADDVDIVFLLQDPDVQVEVGSFERALYCNSVDSTVPVTVTNNGGAGRDLRLEMSLQSVTVTNLGPDWAQVGNTLTYTGGMPSGTIRGGEVVTLNVQVQSAPACTTQGAQAVFTPVLWDACKLLEDAGSAGSSSPVTQAPDAATLNVSKSGPPVVTAGDTYVYTVTVSGENQQSIDAGGIVLTDVLPSDLNIISISVTSGTHSTDVSPVTWDIAAAGSGAYTETMYITVSVPELGAHICDAGSLYQYVNQANALADVCSACSPLQASASSYAHVQDFMGQDNSFTKTASPVEPCAPSDSQVITAVLSIGDGITWTNSIYTDTLGADQFAQPLSVVSGTVQVKVNGVDRTGDVTITLGPPLVIDLSNIGTYSDTAVITITYEVTASATVLGDAASQSEFVFSAFTLGGDPGTACDGSSTGYVGTSYDVTRGDLGISAVPGPIDTCEVSTVTLTILGGSPGTLTDNVVVTFTAQVGDIFTHTEAVLGGALSNTTVISNRVGSTVVFTFPIGLELDVSGTIRFPLFRPCATSGPLDASIGYQDRCHVPRSAQGTAANATDTSNVNLFVTPNEYTVNVREPVTWRFYVNSIGDIAAEDLVVTNTLPAGHRFVTYTVSSTSASTNVVSFLTGTLPGGGEVITFNIASLPVGGRLRFDMRSRLINVCNLPDNIYVALFDDCGGVNGVCQGRQEGMVRLLPGKYFLVSSNDQTANLPLCEIGTIELVVKNSSALAEEFDFTITDMVTNATYAPGTSYVTVTNEAGDIVTGTTSGVLLQSIALTPTTATIGSYQVLTWTVADFAAGTPAYDVLARRDALDVILIRFDVDTQCQSREVTVQSIGAAKDVCEQDLQFVEDAKTLITNIPELQVSKLGRNATTGDPLTELVYASPSDTVVWEVDVENIGTQRCTNLFVTDTVPLTYFQITAASPGSITTTDTAVWGSGGGLTLTVGEIKTFVVTSTISNTVCLLSADNLAEASYGCNATEECPPVAFVDTASVQTRPLVELVQSGGNLSTCGGTITVTLTNNGPPAHDVTITDTLPSKFVYESMVSATTWPSTRPADGNNVAVWTWTGDTYTLPTGQSTLVFRVRQNDTSGICTDPGESVTNTVDILYDDACTDSGPYTVTATNNNIGVTTAVLAVDKSPLKQVSDVNKVVSWTLRVDNTGTGPVPNIVVTDVLASNFGSVSAGPGSYTGGGSNAPVIVGNTITWTPAITLPVGGSWTAVVSATLLASGQNTNTVEAVGSCSAGCVYDSDTDLSYVTLLERFDKVPAVQTDTIGANVVFTISMLLSDHDGLYEDTTLTDTLPTGLGYISSTLTVIEDQDVSTGGPFTATVTPTGTVPSVGQSGNLVWQLGNLSGTVQITGVVTAVIQNIASNQDGVVRTNQVELAYLQDGQDYVFTDTADVPIVEPYLTIVKTVSPTSARPGDTVFYNLSIYHPSSPAPIVPAYNVIVTDVVPAGLNYLPGSLEQTSGPVATTLDATSAPTLSAGWDEIPASVTETNAIRLRYAAVVSPTAPPGSLYTNIATTTWTSLPDDVYGETRDGSGGNGGADDYIVTDTASLALDEVSIGKTGPLTVTAGMPITYFLSVYNAGPYTALNAIVTDTMPFQVVTTSATYAVPGGSSGSCTVTLLVSGDLVVCNVGDIALGVAAQITVTGTVGPDTPEGADLTNLAEFTVTSPDGDSTNNTISVETEVYTEADNRVTKTCQPTAVAGETVTCTIVLENSGPSVSRDVDVKDLLPPGLTWVSGSSTQGTCVSSICQLGDVGVGDVITMTITATIGSDVTGLLTNTAIAFPDTADPNPGNDSDDAPIGVQALTALEIAKVDLTDPVYAGDTYFYEIVVTNTGPSDAQNVVITDDLPPYVSYEGTSPGCSHDDSATNGVVTCSVGTLPAGESRDYLLNVRVVSSVISGTTGINTVSVTTTTDVDAGQSRLNDSETTTYLQTVGNPTDLRLVKSVSPGLVTAGSGVFTYTLVATNGGPAPATAVQVVDAYPRDFDFVSATASDGSLCNSGTTCDLGEMAFGDVVTITLVVEVPSDVVACTYTNTAHVGSASPDSDPGNNDADAPSPVTTTATLQIAKYAQPDPATPGEDLRYTLVITNDGPSDAGNVTVSDTLPAGFSLVLVTSSQGGCAGLPCNLGTLQAGEGAIVWIDGTLLPGASGGLQNTAIVTSTTPGSGDSDTIVTPVSGDADLALDVSSTPTVNAGETVTVTYTVYNNGPGDAENVIITATFPSSVSPPSGWTLIGGGVYTYYVGGLPAGGTFVVTTVVTVSADVQPGTSIEFPAEVGSTTPDPNPRDNVDDADTSVLGSADLGLSKSGPATVTAGQTITYTIVLTNYGPSTARSVDVKDLLPPGLTFESGTSTQGVCVSSICQLGDVGSGDVVTMVITASVGVDLAGVITNTATSFAATPDPTPGNDSADAATDVIPIPALAVVKTLVEPPTGYAVVSDTITYTIRVQNVGPTPLVSLTVTDTYDTAYLSLTSYDPTPDSQAPGLATWSDNLAPLLPLDPGEALVLTVDFHADASTWPGTTVNTAAAQGQDGYGQPTDLGEDSADVWLVSPEITVTKTADPDVILAGDTVVYQYAVHNPGDVSLTNVSLVDDHCTPAGLLSGDDGNGLLDPGETWIYRCSMQVFVDTDNTVNVSGRPSDGTGDPLPGIAPVSAQDTASVDVVAPAIDIVKVADPVQIYANDSVTYTYTISNPGDVPLLGVDPIADDTCPAVNLIGPGYEVGDSDTLLDPGEVWVYTCTQALTEDTTNTATATGQPADAGGTALPGIDPVSDEDTAFVDVIAPAIDVVKTAEPVKIDPDDTVTYTFEVSNPGDDPLVPVTISDSHCAPIGGPSGDDGNGELDPGESWFYTCVTAVTTDTINTVTVTGTDSLGGEWVAWDDALVDVIIPGLQLDKVASAYIAYPGASVTYSYTVSNTGQDPLHNVSILDNLCSPLSGPAGDDGNGLLDVGESWVYSCTGTVEHDTLNTAFASALDPLNRPVQDMASAEVNVINPAIRVNKSAEPEVILANELVTYTYEVTNPGDDPLSDVGVTDTHCAVVSGPAAGDDGNSNGLLDPGEVWTYVCTTTLSGDTTNAATASGDDSLGNPVSDTDRATVDVVAPSLSVAKSADPEVLLAGEWVEYTYLVDNTGDTPLVSVRVADDYCLSPGYVSGDLDGDGILDTDETWTYRCLMAVIMDITNTASVSGRPSDGTGAPLPGISPVTDTVTATVDVVAPAIDIVKMADPVQIYANDSVTYTYTISNPGDVPLLGVDPIADDTCPAVNLIGPGYEVGDSDTLLDPGEVWVYTCTQALTEDTTNTATATGQPADAGGTALPGIDPVSDEDTAFVDVIAPAIDVVKTAEPVKIDPDDTVTYTFEVSNPGDDPLVPVTISDSHCAPIGGPSGDDGNGELDPGESWFYTCVTAVTTDTINTVTVTGTDSLGGEWVAWDDALVDVIIPGLQLDKVASAYIAYPGASVTYSYTVSNTGQDPLHNVSILDNLCSPLSGPAGDDGNGLLDVGESWVYSCTGTVEHDTLNTAFASALDPLNRPVQDMASAEVNVINPAIRVNKSAEPEVILANELVTYTYEVTNPGDDPLSDVGVTDTHCAVVSGPAAGDDGNSNGLLDPGEVWTYVCTTTLSGDTTNTATASGDDSLGNPVQDTDQASVDVIAPSVSVLKLADPLIVLPGEMVEYTYQVYNTGDTPLTMVSVNDDTCFSPGYVSGDLDADGVLDTDETWLYRCQVAVTDDVTNTVSVSGRPSDETGDPLPGINPVRATDEETVNVVRPAINVVKSADMTTVYSGTMVTYYYTVTNPGDVPLRYVDPIDDSHCTPARAGGDGNSNGLLDASEIWTYWCTATLTADTLNVVTATGQPTDDNGTALPGIDPVSDEDTAFVDVIHPAIDLVKIAEPLQVLPGTTVNYLYEVRDSGDDPLSDVTITDDTCSLLTRLGGDSNGLLDAGQTWVYLCSTVLFGDTTNTAVVTGTDSLGGDWTDTDSETVDVVISGLQLDKVANADHVYVGEVVTYTYTVRNTGSDPISNVVLTDDLCSPLNFVDGDDAPADGVLNPGETWVYTCAMALSEDTTNVAEVTGEDELGSPVPPDQASEDVDVISPAIRVVKSAEPEVVKSGGTVTYSYLVTNPGDDPLRLVDIEDDTCASVSFIDGDYYHIGHLDPGESWLFECQTTVTSDVTNTVTVTGSDSLDNPVVDTDTATVDAVGPSIEVTKTAVPTITLVGGLVEYGFEVANTGDTALVNISVADDHCVPVSYISGDDGNGILDIGETWLYRCVTAVYTNTTNTVSVSGRPSDETGDPLPGIDPVTDSDTETVTAVDPAINIVKTPDATTVYSGTLVTYAYTVTNPGNVPLVLQGSPGVTDTHCSPVAFLGGDSGNPGWLDPDETWLYRCTAILTFDMTNTAVVTGDPQLPGIDPVSDEDTAFVDVIHPDIDITKMASVGEAQVGDEVIYTYLLTNTGDSPLVDVVMSDDRCNPIIRLSGDGVLDPGETWSYQCFYTIRSTDPDPLLNTVTVSATDELGGEVSDTAQASVDLIFGLVDGTIYIDEDGDGVYTPGVDTPLPGVDVVITASDGLTYSVTTDASGYFSQTVPPGATTVDVDEDDLPAGVVLTTGSTDPTTVFVPPDGTATDDTGYILAADLVVDKSAPATVVAGERIPYTVTVYNLGPSAADNVRVTDTLPVSVTLVTPLPAGCVENPAGTVLCSASSLAAGDSISFTLEVTTDVDVEPGASLENAVVVGSDTRDPNPTNNRDDADTSIVGKADLALNKSGPDSVVAGEQITYTIVVTNNGPSTAQSVDVKDVLPPGVRWVGGSASPQGVCVSGICQLGDVPEGEVVTIVITGEVGSDVTGTLTNEATVFSDSPDPLIGNNSDDAQTDVETWADLSIDKVDLNDPVGPTEGFLYQIVVYNHGPSDALDVVVTDTLDSNVAFENASPGCTHDGSGSGGRVTCTIDALPAGQSAAFLIAVTAADVPPGTILLNDVEVGSSTGDPDDANNSDTEDTTVEIELGPTADLGIDKTADPGAVAAGELVNYAITVTNAGPQVATSVTVHDLLPAGTTMVSMTADNPDYADEYCSATGSCFLGTLYTDTVATVSIVVQVNSDYEGDTLVNVARVSADQADRNPGDNITSETVDVSQRADLSILKTDMVDPIIAGEVIVYQIAVTNHGPSDAQTVVVTDSVPLSTTFVSAPPACTESGGLVTCQLGTLPAGESTSVSLRVRVDEDVPDPTTIENTAGVESATPDLDDGNNSDDEQTTVHQSPYNPTDLSITKADGADPVLASGTLTYTLVVVNNGPAPGTNVMVLDALPAGVTYVSATTSKVLSLCSDGVICFLGQVDVGETVIITIVVTVDADQIDDLYNEAYVVSANPDTDPGNDQDDEITEVTTEADLSIVKTADPVTATAGSRLSYNILVSNNGPSDAQDVEVTDVLPAELEGVTWAATQGACSLLGGSTWMCELGTIAAGESAFISFAGTVPGDTTGEMENLAWVASSTDDPDEENNSTEITTPIAPMADVEVRKMATPTVNAGETITYTLIVFNHGPSVALGVRVTDTLPAGVSPILPMPAGCSLLAADVLVCGPVDLAAGEGAGYTFQAITQVDLEPGSSLENVAMVGSLTPDDVPVNNSADADTSIVGLADLEVTKTGPVTATIGDEIVYTIVVTNHGPGVAHDVDMKDSLPPGVTLVSADVERTGTGPAACAGAICQVSNMAPDEVVVVTVVGMVDEDAPEGTIVNEATAFSDTPDPDPSDNSDRADTELISTEPAITLDKELVGFDMDDEFPNYVTFTIEIVNSGATTLAKVPLFDRYDPYFLSFVDATPYPTVIHNNAGLVTWSDLTLGAPYGFGHNLVPGESVDVTVVFSLVHDIITSTTNVAWVEYAEDVNGKPVDPVEDSEIIVGLPTAVDLLYFRATWSDRVVVAEWATAWERDNWGFDLYRSLTPSFADAEWIHFEPGKGRGEFDGEVYRYEDADAVDGQVYYYWLVDIDLDNRMAGIWKAGPVSATSKPLHIYLPVISK